MCPLPTDLVSLGGGVEPSEGIGTRGVTANEQRGLAGGPDPDGVQAEQLIRPDRIPEVYLQGEREGYDGRNTVNNYCLIACLPACLTACLPD